MGQSLKSAENAKLAEAIRQICADAQANGRVVNAYDEAQRLLAQFPDEGLDHHDIAEAMAAECVKYAGVSVMVDRGR